MRARARPVRKPTLLFFYRPAAFTTLFRGLRPSLRIVLSANYQVGSPFFNSLANASNERRLENKLPPPIAPLRRESKEIFEIRDRFNVPH